MKVYCQFLVMSTGYIPGTIPPQFSEENKKPIDLIGSDGVIILDARFRLDALKVKCREAIKKLSHKKIVGFKIIRATSFSEKGKELYVELNKT